MGEHRQGGSDPARRLPLRRGVCAGCGLLALLALSAAADDREPSSPRVRVLLLETGDPIRVRGAGASATTTVAPAANGLAADSKPVGRVWRAEGDGEHTAAGWHVRGGLEVHRVESGIQVVNRVDLEDYVAGTLGREIYPYWDPEMLKAQAVVARTYALHQSAHREDRAFDLRGDTSGQVYGGIEAETPAVLAAVRATRGQYLAWDGSPILAVYHSASGGRTASAEEVWGRRVPYLVSLEVEGEEDSPDTYWRATVSGTTLGRALASLGLRVGRVREVRITERSESGRALRIAVRGDEGSEKLDARALRSAVGESVLRSTLFEIRPGDGVFVFVGSGHGHGVGMSQWGGQAMASRGASYREILATFYPGTEVVQ